jgi:transglutaminase-like putative cysteine protease
VTNPTQQPLAAQQATATSLHRLFITWLVRLLLCLATTSPAWSQGNPTLAAHLRIVRIESDTTVNADLTTRTRTVIEREALTDQGLPAVGKFAQFYSKTLQSLEIDEAYTLKADGRRIPVGADGLQRQAGVVASGVGQSWTDGEVLQLTFPDVQRGDRTVLTYTLRGLATSLPGWVAGQDYLVPFVGIDRFRWTLRAARSVDLQVVAPGLRLSPMATDGDWATWTIEGSSTAHDFDRAPANTLKTYPRVMFSSFRQHEQLAQAFGAAMRTRLAVSDEVRRIATDATQGLSSPHDKARALYLWMHRNIRYVAVYLGAGGWVPHDVDTVLKNRYGDCKDQVLLLTALLQAVDIEAAPALLNTFSEYALTELPVSNSFNHVITYLPALNLFVDTTAGAVPFGVLPGADADKPVAVALPDGGRLMRTPAFTAENNRAEVRSVWQVGEDGSAALELSVRGTGPTGALLRERLHQIPAGGGPAAVQRLLEASGWRGRGTVQHPPLRPGVQTQTLRLNATIENLLPDPQAGSLPAHPMLSDAPIYVLSQLGDFTAATRRYPMVCPPVSVREDFELRWPASLDVVRVPRDLDIDQPADGLRFTARYTLDGRTVKGWRELTLARTGHVCSVEEYARLKPAIDQVTQHLRSSVLYQRP